MAATIHQNVLEKKTINAAMEHKEIGMTIVRSPRITTECQSFHLYTFVIAEVKILAETIGTIIPRGYAGQGAVIDRTSNVMNYTSKIAIIDWTSKQFCLNQRLHTSAYVT